jgi:hypothetical protein
LVRRRIRGRTVVAALRLSGTLVTWTVAPIVVGTMACAVDFIGRLASGCRTDKLTDVRRGDVTSYFEDVERRSVEDRSAKRPDLTFY